MKILLTGSSGYIGRHLIEPLVQRGHTIVGFDREPPAVRGCVEHVQADLLDEPLVRKALEDVDCVFHLAAAKDDWGLSRQEYFRDNLAASRQLLRSGRDLGVSRWVFFSTVSVLGPSDERTDEAAERAPIHPYGESKAEAELLFRKYAEDHPEAEIVLLRPSVVFGPGNPPNTNMYRLIDAIARDRFVMVGNGNTRKSTSYIENLVEATLFVFKRMSPGLETFIYVDEPVLTTDEIVDRIYRHLDKSRPDWCLPRWIAERVGLVGDLAASLSGIDVPITAARIRKFCTSTYFDGGAIRREGFEQPVSNADAIERTVADYLARAAQRGRG